MKTQKYLVEIELPDGDYIGPEWLKDDLQSLYDRDEDAGRIKMVKVNAINTSEDELLNFIIANKDELTGAVKYAISILRGDYDEGRPALDDFLDKLTHFNP